MKISKASLYSQSQVTLFTGNKARLYDRRMSLGNKIAAARERLELTQQQVADALGEITASAVSQWERDESKPEIDRLIPLAQKLQVTVDWLLSDSRDEPPPGRATGMETFTVYPFSGFDLAAHAGDLVVNFRWIEGRGEPKSAEEFDKRQRSLKVIMSARRASEFGSELWKTAEKLMRPPVGGH